VGDCIGALADSLVFCLDRDSDKDQGKTQEEELGQVDFPDYDPGKIISGLIDK